MAQGPRSVRNRDRRGSATTKLVVWIVVLFGLYGGYKFMTVALAKNRVARAVEITLADISHDAHDESIRRSIAKYASVASIPIDEEAILVDREARPGERIIRVALEFPMTVSFLGSDRTIMSDVQATRVIRVDEDALARRADAQRRRREETASHRRAMQDAWDECEAKHGVGNCEYSEIPGGSGEIIKDF